MLPREPRPTVQRTFLDPIADAEARVKRTRSEMFAARRLFFQRRRAHQRALAHQARVVREHNS